MLFKNIIQLSKMSTKNNCLIWDFVSNGKKIVGAGLNYNAVCAAFNLAKPEEPVIFLKPSSSYITEGQDIIIPKGWTVNEEIELGVVIGERCKNVSECEALDYVAGYCLALDLTATSELSVAREKGFPWTMAKGFDTACPVSRFITKRELPDPDNANIWVKVNGEMRQKSNTSDLIFSVAALISYTSKYMTLEPYDLILTGTPPGMSLIYPGDCIEGGINRILEICFKVTQECEPECE